LIKVTVYIFFLSWFFFGISLSYVDAMVRGYCVQCEDYVSNKADHLGRFPDHTIRSVPNQSTVENCASGVHILHFQMLHIPRINVAQGMQSEFLSASATARISLPSGHVERLFCIHCGHTVETKYVVYRHNQHGDLVAMLPLDEGGTGVVEEEAAVRFRLFERFVAIMLQAKVILDMMLRAPAGEMQGVM